ncbi:hypothetical protein ACFLXE_05255 [Chloroflexota bacterium]
MEASSLIDECRAMGATFTLVGDQVRVRASNPLPDCLVATLRQLKPDVVAVLRGEKDKGFHCWMLEEWRRVSIPDWQRILAQSIEQGDTGREKYARWMLREVLLASEYAEDQS